jgi:hypothetical protein
MAKEMDVEILMLWQKKWSRYFDVMVKEMGIEIWML